MPLPHTELQQLGSPIPATDFEVSFGPATADAVRGLQPSHGLSTTGVVDPATADKINAAVDALPHFIIRDQVRQIDGSVLVGAIVKAAK